MKMMIVDDSLIIRRKIEREVSLSAISEVITAKNGKAAVELFQQHKPELVTMDLTMPEMNGEICVKEIIKIDPNAIILVISALADKATAIKAIKNGARGFLCKPFTEEALNETLVKLIEDVKKMKASAC